MTLLPRPLDFSRPARLLQSAIAGHAFPAAVIEVGRRDRVLWRRAIRPTHVRSRRLPHHRRDHLRSGVADQGHRDGDADDACRRCGCAVARRSVASRLPTWRGADRETVTIRDLLAHASGLTAYLPFFRDHHGRAEFERSICPLPLEYCTALTVHLQRSRVHPPGLHPRRRWASSDSRDQFARLWDTIGSDRIVAASMLRVRSEADRTHRARSLAGTAAAGRSSR